MMYKNLSAALVAALLLAGCGGGGGGSNSSSVPYNPSGSNSGPTDSGLAVGPQSIATTNALGTTVQSFSAFEFSEVGSQFLTALTLRRMPSGSTTGGNGTCNNGVISNAPDLANQPNSTEFREYYDSGCTYIARDTVRLFQASGTNGEIVTTTQNQYAYALKPPKVPNATRSDVTNFSNATFTVNGYPSVTAGYVRSSSGFLYIGSSKTIISDYDLVMDPGSGGTNTFCSDDAGFNLVVVDTNDGVQYQSYGWGSIVSSGQRTVNQDGTVTWSGSHVGTDYSGTAGSIRVIASAPNTSCPITNPEFSVSGPTLLGTNTFPVSATYTNGELTNLTVTNALLASGITLNVTTNATLTPGNSDYINGVLTGPKNATIATFNVDAFGDGTLTQNYGGGNQYVITDWHVMHNPAI